MGHDTRLGERLRQVRVHREVSQRQLAGAIGVSISTIQSYEHGRVIIAIDRIEHLARALQCEVLDLMMPPGAPLPRYRHRYRPRLGQQFSFDLDDE
jgi:transcriptional regulator with XRE-family HTH domain